MPRVNIDIGAMELAQQLEETVQIERADLSADSGGNIRTTVASGVRMVIVPATSTHGRSVAGGDFVRATGEVISQGEFEGLMVTPNDNVIAGDVVVRTGQPILYCTDVFRIETVQWMRLSQTRR